MLLTSAMMRSRTSTRGEPVSAAKTSPNRAIPKAPPDGELERSLFRLLVFFSFLMSYSLNAFLPFEGNRIAFNGELGRLEIRDYERQPWDVGEETEIYVTKSFDRREKIEVPRLEGGHGGGDVRLHDTVWRNAEIAPYLALPDSRAGALSCLTGIAARKSIEEKRTVRINELVRL